MLTVKILGSGCANCKKLEAVAREGMRLAAAKLPIRTKFISRHAAAA